MLLKVLKSCSFTWGFLKKKLLITLIRIGMQARNMRGEMIGKHLFCLPDCWWGWDAATWWTGTGYIGSWEFGDIVPEIVFAVSLCQPVCLLAFGCHFLAWIQEGKWKSTDIAQGHPQKWLQGYFYYIIEARENPAGLWMIVAKWVGENWGFKIQKL